MPRTSEHQTSNPLLIHGANVSELAIMFGLQRKEAARRLENVPPTRRVGGISTWRISDVAHKLVRIDDSMSDLISTVLSTHHTDLPKMLSKEYWYGQNQRLRYMRDIGDLWDTHAVVELASEVFKTLRLSLMLAADSVERETGLTLGQREIIENLMHAALEEAREKLVGSLVKQRKNSSGKAFAPREGQPVAKSHVELDEWGDPVVGSYVADDL